MKICLDANCFLDALNSASPSNAAMQTILKAWEIDRIKLWVSQHTLAELEVKPDTAFNLAKHCKRLPHWGIGTWNDQVGSWDQMADSWDDAKQNQAMQSELEEIAKAGNSLRDRGSYLDALKAEMDVFMTSDRQFSKSSPARRIENRFGLKVMTPEQFVSEYLCIISD